MLIEQLLILLSVVSTSAGLIFFKKFSVSVNMNSLDEFVKTAFNRYFVFAGICISSSSLCFILALSKLELAVAYSFTSLTNVFVLIGAALFLKEKVVKSHVFGVLFIVMGLLLFHI